MKRPILFFVMKLICYFHHFRSKESMGTIMKEELKEMVEQFSAKEKDEVCSFFIGLHKYGLDNSHASPAHLFSLAHTYKQIYDKKVNSRGS